MTVRLVCRAVKAFGGNRREAESWLEVVAAGGIGRLGMCDWRT